MDVEQFEAEKGSEIQVGKTELRIRILIIDDDPVKILSLESILDTLPVEVIRASSGAEGIALLSSMEFALILLDVKLPGMDGFEIAKLIRQMPSRENLPILFISAYQPSELDLSLGYSLGAVDYVFSPIQPVALKAKVQFFTELYRKSWQVQKQAEVLEMVVRERTRALRTSEERLRWLVENTTDIVWRFQLEKPISTHISEEEQIDGFYRFGFLSECNDAMAKVYGHTVAGDIIGARLGDFLVRTEPRNEQFLRSFVRSGYRLIDAESVETDHEGNTRYILNNLVGVVEKDTLLGAWGTSRDFTDHRKAEEEFRKSRDQLDAILQGVSTAITAQDAAGRVIFANMTAAKKLGYASVEALLKAPSEEISGRFEVLDEGGNPYPLDRLPWILALEGMPEPQAVLRYRRMETGEETWFIVKTTPIRDEAGRIRMVIIFFQDITGIKKSEIELRNSKEQLSIILEGIADAILVQDGVGKLIYVNYAAARLLDFNSTEELLAATAGPQADEIRKKLEIRDEAGGPVPPELTPTRLALQGREVPPTVLRYRMNSQSSERWVISRAKPILDGDGKVRFVVAIVHDVTDLRKAEEKFRQSQKMEAVGRLAGGIAHDFNNLLTAINGYAELLLASTGSEDGRRSHIEEIHRAGERAASLTNQLLVYSRREIIAPKILNLNTVVSHMDKLLQRLIGEDIDLITLLDSDLGLIKADQGQMEQIILNLAVNARDAMPDGGKLTLQTGNVEVGDTNVGMETPLQPGPYVLFSVSDTGVGMDDNVKLHLFEPFFTTKKAGKGTGLGLSTVYGVVKQSGGAITVYSEPGQGTTFKVYFPSVGEKEMNAFTNRLEPVESSLKGSETIMVVEDDKSVRKLVVSILSSLGYTVLDLDDGVSALEAARTHAGKIDVLLTDVVMARMGGRELAVRLREIRPEIRTIYMSGYTDDAIVRHGVLASGEYFLQKPFSPPSLARKLREVLEVPALAVKSAPTPF